MTSTARPSRCSPCWSRTGGGETSRPSERPDGFHWSSQEKPVQSFMDPQAEAVEGQPARFTPEDHRAVCPHHAVIVDTYNAEPIHVCTDPAASGHQPFRQGPVTASEEDR